MKLSKHEKEILESVERGEWRSVRGAKKQMERYQDYARATVRKDKRVNIRMSEKDLVGLQKRAMEDGFALSNANIQYSAQVHQRSPRGQGIVSFQRLGVRIEDDVLVTKTGHKILTRNCSHSYLLP